MMACGAVTLRSDAVDNTPPVATIVSTDTEKSTTQTATITCTDGV